jgi:hypothetical protein
LPLPSDGGEQSLVAFLVFKTSGSLYPERWVRFPSASAQPLLAGAGTCGTTATCLPLAGILLRIRVPLTIEKIMLMRYGSTLPCLSEMPVAQAMRSGRRMVPGLHGSMLQE